MKDKPVIKNYLLDGTQLDIDGKDQHGKQL